MNWLIQIIEFLNIYVENNYLISILIFFLILFLHSSFSLPGLILLVGVAGYLFGLINGFFISILSITFGSLIFFILSKYFLKSFFSKFFKKYSKGIEKYVSNSSFEYLIILRMIPGPPLMFQNFIISLLNISISKFIISTFIGFTPLIFLISYIGNKTKNFQEIKNINLGDILTWDFIVFILIFLILLIVRINFKNKKSPQ